MSDLCKCGHDERFHGSPDDGSVICGLCMAICKQPPPADRDDLAAILAKHAARDNYDDDGEYIGYICKCRAPESGPYDTDLAAHQAQMVLESDWLRGVRAKVWDEGVQYMAERCVDEHGISATYRLGDNPYRADRNHADGTPRRLAACAEANPANDDYHPGCCRFPKSCSPYPYAETPVTESDLEPYRADRVDADTPDNTTDRT